MKKDYIKSVVVLGTICLIIAVALAAINYVTAPIIADNAERAVKESLGAVLEGAEDFEEIELPSDAPETVQTIYREQSGKGYAVALATTSSYSGSPMTFTLGVGADGKIAGVKITNYAETKDFGAAYPESYIGADSTLSGIDLVSGVTYSSTAFKNAVSDALQTLVAMGEIGEGEKTAEQSVTDMLPDILPGALDASGNAKVAKLEATDAYTFGFKADNGCGYVFCTGEEGNERVLAVSATGGIAAYGLNCEASVEFTTDEYSALTAAAEFNYEAADSAASEIMGDRKYDRITVADQFGSVIGAYKIDDGGYLFIAAPYGYMEPMAIGIELSGDGKIVTLKSISELIQFSDHYSDYSLDEAEYVKGFVGANSESYGEDLAMISGATITSSAVNTAVRDAFDAFAAERSEH